MLNFVIEAFLTAGFQHGADSMSETGHFHLRLCGLGIAAATLLIFQQPIEQILLLDAGVVAVADMVQSK